MIFASGRGILSWSLERLVYGKLRLKTRVELVLYAANTGDLGDAAPEHLAVV